MIFVAFDIGFLPTVYLSLVWFLLPIPAIFCDWRNRRRLPRPRLPFIANSDGFIILITIIIGSFSCILPDEGLITFCALVLCACVFYLGHGINHSSLSDLVACMAMILTFETVMCITGYCRCWLTGLMLLVLGLVALLFIPYAGPSKLLSRGHVLIVAITLMATGFVIWWA